MSNVQRRKLEQHGWTTGNTAEFLELSAEEAAYIEMKLALSRALKQERLRRKLTQTEVAGKLHSSQSRVAKMEAADRTVSVDLLVRSLLALGTRPKDIAHAMDVSTRKRTRQRGSQ